MRETAATGARTATTLGQAAIWYADQKAGGTSAFNVCTVVAVDGGVPVADVRRACRRLAHAVPELRLRFTIDEWTGEVVQWLCREPLEIRHWDRSTANGDEAAADDGRGEAAAHGWLESEAARLFDSDGGALTRFAVAPVSPHRVLVGIIVHHVVLDGAAQVRLVRRFADCVSSEPAPRPVDDYLSLIDRVRAAEARSRADDLAYWRERIGSMTGGVHGAVAGGDSGSGRFVLPEPAVRRLTARAAELGTGVFPLLIAAVQRSVAGLDPGQQVITAAASLRPRTGDGGNEAGGCFVNQVPLAVAPAETGSLDALVRVNHPRWASDLRRRTFPFIDLTQMTRVALDRVLVSHRRAPARLRVGGPGGIAVTADLLVRYPQAKTDLAIRFFHDRTIEYDVEWRLAAWPDAATRLGDDLNRWLEGG